MKVRIGTTTNAVFDLDLPDDLIFQVFIANIRAAGYFQADNLYICADFIVFIGMMDSRGVFATPAIHQPSMGSA